MDEFLDIVDNDDLVTGRELRSVVHQLGLQHRGVHIFLFTTDGRILIQKRSADRSAYPSMWDGSVSEHVKAGESYLNAAIRGIKEELNLTGLDLKPLITFKMNYGPNDNEISRLYRGTVDPTKVKFDPVEIEQIDYTSERQLMEMIKEGKETICGWFVQMIRWSQGEDSELQILKIHSKQLLFADE
jgi:isopentenyl-diphosphate delta-isomerase